MAGLAMTLVGVGLAYRFRGGRHESRPVPPPNLPSGVDQQVSGYTFTRSDQQRQIFTIHAARTEALKEGGPTILEDVVVEVFGRKGDRRDVLRTQRAEYNSRTGGFLSPGATSIVLNSPSKQGSVGAKRGVWPVYLDTSGVTYQPQGSLLTTDEAVEFRLGIASGSARGMVYATKDGRVELKSAVRAEWRAPGPGGPATLAASRLYYDKESGKVELSGPLVFSRGAGRVTAAGGIITLDSSSRLESVDLNGGVHVSDQGGKGERPRSATVLAGHLHGDFDSSTTELRTASADGGIQAEIQPGGDQGKGAGQGKGQGVPAPGSLAMLQAEKGEISFSGAHATPAKGDVAGNVRVTIWPSPAGGAGRSLTRGTGQKTDAETKVLSAAQLDFTFRPDGRSVDQARTVGEGKITFSPLDPNQQGERELTAGQLVMAFDAKSRLTDLSGRPGVQLKFHPPAGTPPGIGERETSSEAFDAKFNPLNETLEAFEQTAQFAYKDDERQASAARAEYSPGLQLLTLTGHPKMWDGATSTSAERVLLHPDTQTAEGIGKVEATHLEPGDPESGAPPRANGPGARTEGAPAESSATHVLADRVRAEKKGQVVHYEGHVRAWHGADVIESASLDYYGQERRLTSPSSVLTSHLAPLARPSVGATPGPAAHWQDTSRASAGASRPLTIRADHLDYLDEGREARYRGNVELETAETTLHSDRMDAYFSSASSLGGSQVQRVVADGHVRVDQADRHASGEHADYQAAAGRIVLTGGPPSIYEEEKGFTTGQSLTFYIHDDTLSVDGGAESPTISKRVAQ